MTLKNCDEFSQSIINTNTINLKSNLIQYFNNCMYS